MSALITWSVTDGDDRVNAKEGLDEEAATTIAAPAIATRTPLAMRRVVIGLVSSRLPSEIGRVLGQSETH